MWKYLVRGIYQRGDLKLKLVKISVQGPFNAFHHLLGHSLSLKCKWDSSSGVGGGDPDWFYLDVCTSPCVHICTWVLILAVFSCFPTFPVILCWCNCNWRLGQEYSGSQRNGKKFCCFLLFFPPFCVQYTCLLPARSIPVTIFMSQKLNMVLLQMNFNHIWFWN